MTAARGSECLEMWGALRETKPECSKFGIRALVLGPVSSEDIRSDPVRCPYIHKTCA